MFKRYSWLIAIVLVIMLMLSGCAAQSPPASSPVPVTEPAAPEQTVLPPSGQTFTDIESTLEHIYAEVNASVVNIRILQKEEVMFPTFPEIPGFPFFSPPTPQEPQERYLQGLGSGFVWDDEGHIVTNNHVVADADRISVTFHDGTTVPGKVGGTDPDSDLAVVKVEVSAEQLKPVQVADSTQVKVGQLAVAIGNPFGLQGTMTVGFVSALGRLLPTESENPSAPTYSIPDVIQTDAPINPGNSGGVLLDSQGNVIGVTSAIISPAGANAGIGFAIPSAIVQKVVPALIETGHYEHPWLGVSGVSLSPDLAKAMDLEPGQRGALIVDVVPGSPADKSGLYGSDRNVTIEGETARVGGDIVTAIEGQPVKSFDDLVTYLARSTEIGQTVTLTVLRHGEEDSVKVTLTARPQTETQPDQAKVSPTSGAWLGIWGLTVTPEIADTMDLTSDQTGVLVEQVQQGSPADQAGLHGSYKPVVLDGNRILVGGDIIIGFGGVAVNQIEDLQAQLSNAQPGQEVVLKILRDGKNVQVKVILGEQ